MLQRRKKLLPAPNEWRNIPFEVKICKVKIFIKNFKHNLTRRNLEKDDPSIFLSPGF